MLEEEDDELTDDEWLEDDEELLLEELGMLHWLPKLMELLLELLLRDEELSQTRVGHEQIAPRM